VALYIGAAWLAVLLLAYQFKVRGAGRVRAELGDETASVPVVKTAPADRGNNRLQER